MYILKEPRGGLTAVLLFYLLVSAYQILIVGSASALFPQLYYTLSSKEKIKYSSQNKLFFVFSLSPQVCALPFLARSFGVLAKN
jgi:hypothetical protein